MSEHEIKYPDFTGLTFEKVWAALMENREQMRETDRKIQETAVQMQESDRKFQEYVQEARQQEQELREEVKKTEKAVAAFTKSVDKFKGEVGNRLGEVAEHLVAPGIRKKFNELGFHFREVQSNVEIVDEETRKTLLEIDILLVNSESIIVVEVKMKPLLPDIERLTQRLVRLREYRNKYCGNEPRVIYGCLAGAVFIPAIQQAAKEAGFYVITQSGDTMQIENAPDFQPKAF